MKGLKSNQPGVKKRINVCEKRLNAMQPEVSNIKVNIQKMAEAQLELGPQIKAGFNNIAIAMSVLKLLEEKGVWSYDEFTEFLERQQACQTPDVTSEEPAAEPETEQ